MPLTILRPFVVLALSAVCTAASAEDRTHGRKAGSGDLPAQAARSIEEAFPDASIVRVQRNREAGLPLFDVTIEDTGGVRDVRISAEGVIVTVEREVKVADLPPALVAAVRQNTTDTLMVQVETRVEIDTDAKGVKTIQKLATPRLSFGPRKGVDIDRDGRVWKARRKDAGEEVGPGEEGLLEVPGYKPSCVVYLPSDYRAGVEWPLILHLHGSGDAATTWPWLWGTNGKGYIIVGLSYVKGNGYDPATVRAMIKYIDAVRELVDKKYGLDESRVFLSGTSMGGWAVNYYGFNQAAKGRYRGYCILAAGPSRGSGIDFSVAQHRPVLVLNGQKDENYATAQQGVPLLKRAGADVTAVVLPGEGHMPDPNKIWPPLEKWLSSADR